MKPEYGFGVLLVVGGMILVINVCAGGYGWLDGVLVVSLASAYIAAGCDLIKMGRRAA